MKSNRQTATAATAFAERWKGIEYEKGGSQLHSIEFWRKPLALFLDLLRMGVAWFLIQFGIESKIYRVSLLTNE